MIEMTLSSRHRIRNSSPDGLRPRTLPLGHGGSPQYWLSHVDGEETFFVSFKPPRPGTELPLVWKAAVLFSLYKTCLETRRSQPDSNQVSKETQSQPGYPTQNDNVNMNYIMLKKKIIHRTSLTLSAQGPFLDVRIWRLHVWTSDSPQ